MSINAMHALAFSVNTDGDEDTVTERQMMVGLLRRITSIVGYNEVMEATFEACDVYEDEDEDTTPEDVLLAYRELGRALHRVYEGGTR